MSQTPVTVDGTGGLPAMRCPSCGRLEPVGSIMCEDDGSLLVQAQADVLRDRPEDSPCRGCGAPPDRRNPSGECRLCGADWLTPRQDRVEIELGADLAAVSDRCSPQTHLVNQDAVWITRGAVGDKVYYVGAVADGVSHAYRSQFASALVLARACPACAQALEAGRTDLPAILREAVLDGSLAVRTLPYDPDATASDGSRLSPPATTLVLCILLGDQFAFASVGDSRGYTGVPGGLVQCTRDDSGLQQLLDHGVPEEAALLDPRAHAISRWVGTNADQPPFEPNIVPGTLPPGALLLLCTDGVWGYAPHIADLNTLAFPPEHEQDPALAVCRRLVDRAWSQEQDPQNDNASAVVIRPVISTTGDSH